jgi:AcrR family transcriptional regulator
LGRTALIVAHPGHELMVYNWMERRRPLYFCLTDGSGGSATSRLPSTSRVLARVGAGHGMLYGRYSDKEIYRLLLQRRVDMFVDLAKELAGALIEAQVDGVAGDAAEGFNPAHDVCRFLIEGAVALVRRRTGRVLRNHDFVLEATPDTCPATLRPSAEITRLDEPAVARKLDAALSYPELRHEISAALGRFGKRAFALECLRPATAATRLMIDRFESEAPAYERSGGIRVGEGRYREIIRYREHLWPVRRAIQEAVHE